MSVFPGTFKHGAAAYGNHHCRCSVCVSAKRKASADTRKRLLGTEPPVHGTTNGYSVYGCRCEACVSARKKSRDGYTAKLLGKEPPKHGFTGYAIYGCRCEICVRARKKSDEKRRSNPAIVIGEKERGWSRIGIRGFNFDRFKEMYESQNGKCSICGDPISLRSDKKSDVAQVDHDHRTGVVRALLCHNCNKMIGCGRNSENLMAGAAYLERHGV